MRKNLLWRVTLLWLCALVFFFALHAKTAVYNGGAPAKATPSTASKLWLSGQKMEAQTPLSPGVVLFWIAFTCLFSLYLLHEPKVRSAVVVRSPDNLRLWQLHRFLRPPPFQN